MYEEEFGMLARLQDVERKYERLTERLADPSLSGQQGVFRELSREHADLTPLIEAWRHYKSLQQQVNDNRQLLNEEDAELAALAREELKTLDQQITDQELVLRRLLLPRDPNDDRNILLEIRAGTGGDEASLFAADLFRMYTRYAEGRRWKVDVLSTSPSAAGGFKEVVALIEGQGAYSQLKYEGGVHRVQRVPATEAQGRIHTSAATVAILPEADEVEVQIEDRDLRIDVYRSSGPGGQSVNTTDSAVRITHLASGLVVTCQDEKSQHKNKAKALKILQARLLERKQSEAAAETAATRKAMVGSGDRSERIRTYNFPQGRITDHRIGLTLYSLDTFIAGNIQEVIDALHAYHETEALKAEFSGDERM